MCERENIDNNENDINIKPKREGIILIKQDL